MRKKRSRLAFLVVILFIIIIVAVIILANLGTPYAQLVAGVKEGDVFTYEMEGLWKSDDPTATISDTVLLSNMTEWYRVTITNVFELEISIHTVWRFKNGTEIEGDGKVNIETGIYSGGFWTIYAANLDAGKMIHPQGSDQVTINSTLTREYPDGARETNCLLLTAQLCDVNDPSCTYSDDRTIEFDKQTGILVEFYNQNIYNSPEMTEIISWKLVDSNIWNVT